MVPCWIGFFRGPGSCFLSAKKIGVKTPFSMEKRFFPDVTMPEASKAAAAALHFMPELVIFEGRLAGKPLKLAGFIGKFRRETSVDFRFSRGNGRRSVASIRQCL